MSDVAYEPVIGLEIHVQLRTRTKMFCGCELSFGEPPNTRTCPVCLGHPGALPVTNAQAVHFGLMIGLALGCEIAPRSIFHRKNYFYPDLPKGYQISQYDIPLGSDGRLGEVRINRVHLEEDAAKLVHAGTSGRIHSATQSVVDFNRGGTPLVEIVTEPDVRSAAQASEWLRLLRATLKRLGVSDVNMDEGSLRCDGNVSLRPVGTEALGVKTELKNMNSFRFLERGLDAEIARQEEILRSGGTVEQQTLHFDPRTGGLSSMRSKEEAHDYRYFPEPDLVPLAPTEAMLSRANDALPELPAERAERFESVLSLAEPDARLFAFRGELGDYFEAALAVLPAEVPDGPRTLANWVKGEVLARVGEDDIGASKAEPQRSPSWSGWSRRARCRSRPRRKSSTCSSSAAAIRPRWSQARGSDARGGRAGGDRRPCPGRERRRGREGARRQPQGDRRDRRSRDAGDEGPRRRRRGPADDRRAPRLTRPREGRRLSSVGHPAPTRRPPCRD